MSVTLQTFKEYITKNYGTNQNILERFNQIAKDLAQNRNAQVLSPMVQYVIKGGTDSVTADPTDSTKTDNTPTNKKSKKKIIGQKKRAKKTAENNKYEKWKSTRRALKYDKLIQILYKKKKDLEPKPKPLYWKKDKTTIQIGTNTLELSTGPINKNKTKKYSLNIKNIFTNLKDNKNEFVNVPENVLKFIKKYVELNQKDYKELTDSNTDKPTLKITAVDGIEDGKFDKTWGEVDKLLKTMS